MSRITITLHIDIPDDAKVATPDVDYSSGSKAAATTSSVAADEPPLPEAPSPGEPPPYLVAEARQVLSEQAPQCPQHGEMKRYPAGTSKKTGKPFNASWRCQKFGCETSPIWDKDAA